MRIHTHRVTAYRTGKSDITPALSWLENVNSLRYFGRMLWPNLSRIKSCGRQFLTCGGPSSSLSRANRAADMDRPRMPSPHSFSALQALNRPNISQRQQRRWLVNNWRILPLWSLAPCKTHSSRQRTRRKSPACWQKEWQKNTIH